MKQISMYPTSFLLLALLSGGCGDGQRDPEEPLLQPQQQALERAAAVEQQLLDSAEQTARAIDESD